MQFKNIIFDLDRTLAFDHHLEFDMLKQVAHREISNEISDPQILEVLLRFRSGKATLKDALRQGFTDWGLSSHLSEKATQDFIKQVLIEAKLRVTAVEGFKKVIKEIENRKIPYAMVTNGWKVLQELKAQLIGFSQKVITSEELDLWKPDPQLYIQAAKLLNFVPQETVYIGDAPEGDMVGAKSAGFKAIWANYSHHNYPANLLMPDAVIERFEDLIPLLP